MIRLSAFRWVPPFAQGLVRDLRVRWALEEAGLPYEVMLIGPDDQKSAAYRAMQPFGQVPAIDDDGLVLFESCAIVMHLGERSEALMPRDAAARARVRTWMLAALNTIEPPITTLNVIDLQPGGAPAGAKDLRDSVVSAHRRPPRQPRRLPRRPRAPGRGSLHRRRPADDDGAAHPAHHRSGRPAAERSTPTSSATRPGPAFQKALADQMAAFARHAPPAQATQ